jgi:hypothetical protein
MCLCGYVVIIHYFINAFHIAAFADVIGNVY